MASKLATNKEKKEQNDKNENWPGCCFFQS